MKMSVRKIFTLLMTLSLVCALAVPAFAADFPAFLFGPQSRSEGYESQTIYWNGKPYTCEFSLGSSSANGAYSSFKTSARVDRTHNDVTVKFDTRYDGYDTQTGGATTITNHVGTSTSGYVPCKFGMAAVIGYVYIGGSGTVTADKTYSFMTSAS